MPLTSNIDEAAVLIHKVRRARVAASLCAAGMSLLLLPWNESAAWLAIGLGLEAWGFLCTRAQFAGRRVGRATQAAFALNFALLNVQWLGLAVLLWLENTLAAQVCTVAILATVASLILLLVYQRALTFVLAGAGPPAAALLMLAVHGHLSPAWLPAILVLGAALIFAAILAHDVPSALAAERALNASQAQYRVMADSTSDVISRHSLDGARRYLSPSAQRLTGFSAAELEADGLRATVHPDDIGYVSATAQAVAAGEGDATTEARLITKTGAVIWVETNLTLAPFDGPDAPREILAVTRDITARKQLEFELIAARERAEAASQAKSDFLANMSHELRTPLNAVIGFSRLLRDSEGLSTAQVHHAKLIDDGGTALLAVINDVLDFSRLEAGAVEVAAAPFDPTDLVRSMGELLRLQAAGKQIALEVSANPAASSLVGDVGLMRQVLLNLIGNALKFTEQGGVTVTAEQTDSGPGLSNLRVTVRDTGIGLSPSQLARVFGRFEQADASMSRRFGGAGLGLAISQRLVGLMGGRIGADSIEGEGSTFWFELDLPKATAAPIEPRTTPAAEAAAGFDAPDERAPRVLVVDDVAVNRELVVTLLSAFDVDCVTARDGAEALALAGREAFDIILMDVQMPVMDGLAATRALRALPGAASAAAPIIALTANVLPEQVARCLEAGMDDHIGKPIETQQLLEVIQRWMDPQARSRAGRAVA